MADIKLNVVGHAKLGAMMLTFGIGENDTVECFNCEKTLDYVAMQVDHISHRNGILYGDSSIHRLSNLCPLCKRCNSEKGKMEARNFYGARKYNRLMKIVAKCVDVKDARVEALCIRIAKSNISRKFTRTYKGGHYFNCETAFGTDVEAKA